MFAGLEKQLSSEKATRTNLEKETNELRKKITLLEYDLQESQQSQKRTSSLKEKADLEVSILVRFLSEKIIDLGSSFKSFVLSYSLITDFAFQMKELFEAKNLELKQKSQLQTEVTTLKNELSRLKSSESQATKVY